jgi:hypothetical protein
MEKVVVFFFEKVCSQVKIIILVISMYTSEPDFFTKFSVAFLDFGHL